MWGSGTGAPARGAGRGRLTRPLVSSFAAPPPKRRRLDGVGQHSLGLAETASSSGDDDDEQPPPGALASDGADPVPRAAAAAAVAGGQRPATPCRSALGLASAVGPGSGESRGDGSDGDGSADDSGAAAPVLMLAATAVSVSSRGGSLDLRLCPGCSRPYNIMSSSPSSSRMARHVRAQHSLTALVYVPLPDPRPGRRDRGHADAPDWQPWLADLQNYDPTVPLARLQRRHDYVIPGHLVDLRTLTLRGGGGNVFGGPASPADVQMLEAIQWTADAGVSAVVAVNLLVGGRFETRGRQAYSDSRPAPAPVGGGAWFWPAVTHHKLRARMCAAIPARIQARAYARKRADARRPRPSRSFGCAAHSRLLSAHSRLLSAGTRRRLSPGSSPSVWRCCVMIVSVWAASSDCRYSRPACLPACELTSRLACKPACVAIRSEGPGGLGTLNHADELNIRCWLLARVRIRSTGFAAGSTSCCLASLRTGLRAVLRW